VIWESAEAISCYNVGDRVKCGDEITRTTATGNERVRLPPIGMRHLLDVTITANGRADGFHICPMSLGTIATAAKTLIASGAVSVIDAAGQLVVGAVIVVTPHRVPASEFDAFEARVEVFDSNGQRVAASSSKSFFPQAWTEAQIEKAIYAAYELHFRKGGVSFFTRMMLATPEGGKIEMRVNGRQTPNGIVLTEIPTAYLIQGQHLDSTHLPK
jgi:Bacterial EndoU nuclease